ncbi:MAG TPA: cell division topological specificity factor MinE [Campylobacterales bacterium]|nr:cell division topological specificity factor MinE [Campylobacterales bacterium]HIP41051.1 cell division topological specificity factor MinE [Campylobacterales bacterium]
MLFDWFKDKKSATIARDRLTIAIMSDRHGLNDYPFMDAMKSEIVEVVKKYIDVRNIDVRKELVGDIEAISIDVELANSLRFKA